MDGALTAIITALKSKKVSSWADIRQVVADADINDFVQLYTGLYDRVTEFTTSPADVAIHSAQYLWQNNTIADKEINFMAFISQILKIK